MTTKVVIGIFNSQQEAANAVDELRKTRFAENDISVLAQTSEQPRPVVEHPTTAQGTDRMMTNLGVAGAIGGLLVGLASIAIPGSGALLVAGPLLAAVSGAAAGGALGVVAGALVHFDVPEYEAKLYESHLTAGKVLVAVHTENPDDRFRAEEIMDRLGAVEIDTKAA